MKITVEFSNLEEFDAFRGGQPIGVIRIPEPVKEEKPAKKAAEPEKKAEAPAKAPEPEEPAKAAEPEKPAEAAPQYTLKDVQAATRSVLKAKGKAAAKEILAKFPDKDHPEAPAEGASAVRPEDYAAAIRALQEALDG